MAATRESNHELEAPEREEAAADSYAAPPRARAPKAPEATFVACDHDVLFSDEPSDRCDVCGELVEEDSGEGPAVPGRGLYVWARGDLLRREEPPLCPACAAALGLSALGRWEIEEEEG